MRLVGGLSIVMVVAVPSYADPRVEIGVGLGLEHLASGTCMDRPPSEPCEGRAGASLHLDVSEDFELQRGFSLIARELAGLAYFDPYGLARGLLGLGVRASSAERYAEVTFGVERMFGTTGAGEGVVSGNSFAVSPRIGMRLGQWNVAVDATWAPQVTTHGLADFDLGVLGSIVIGD